MHLGLSGAHMNGLNSRGVVAVAGKNREIMREDVRRAIDAAKAVTLPAGREIIHVLPQDFVVDEQDGIGAPIGMTGSRLEVNVHIVNGSDQLDPEPDRLRQPRRRARDGIDARPARRGRSGADPRREGARRRPRRHRRRHHRHRHLRARRVWHTGVVAVGGDHFTNDIAVGLRTPLPEAEKIKRRCGCALTTMVGEDETMEVASVGGRKPRVMPRRVLSEILQPRAEEIFHLLWDEIRNAGCDRSLNSGLVLTGGGASLEGMAEIAEQIFDLPVRRGSPAGAGGLIDHVNTPECATAVGLVMYAHRQLRTAARGRGSGGAFARAFVRLRGMFHELSRVDRSRSGRHRRRYERTTEGDS